MKKNHARPLKVIVLGSTGSLGKQTLKLLKKYKKYFEVVGLSANKNLKLLKKQIREFKVKNFTLGANGDIIVNVISGVAGIKPTKVALKAKKILLLGNKESLVADGQKIMRLAGRTESAIFASPSRLIPIDSEHNAIYEILKKYDTENPSSKIGKIKSIVLPCSGGPFINKTKKQLEKVTVTEALRHPKWKMGHKISLESATLINKGLEIIEAHHLFKVPLKKIKVILHPQCKIHGIVEFKNAAVAYFGKPDMSEHLENALLRAANLPLPKRKIRSLTRQEFKQLMSKKVPQKTLPGINMVLSKFQQETSQNRGSLKKFLIKEEKVLGQFLKNKISFLEIFKRLK